LLTAYFSEVGGGVGWGGVARLGRGLQIAVSCVITVTADT